MTSRVAQQVAEFCQKHLLLDRKDKLVVGVSGGPDSLCLLHLLREFSSNFELTLTVAHFNHQLRGDSSQADEDFVREVANDWRLPVEVERCNVAVVANQRGQSLEEAGRQLRYAFLWRVASRVGANKIAVGHNADDQVETVLMHFIRGTGLAGLRGMLPLINIAELRLNPDDIPPASSPSPKLIRPLLEISRPEIEAYNRACNLSPRQDASNWDTAFFRNRLRQQLIPYLETYNPKIRQVLRRTARVVAADVEILQARLDQVWPAIVVGEATHIVEFDLKNWLALPLALKRATLRRAVQLLRRSLRDINFEHIETAIDIIGRGNTGAKATLPQGLILTVGYHSFTIAPESMEPQFNRPDYPYLAKRQPLPVNLPGVTRLPDARWQLTAHLLPGGHLSPERIHQISRWEAYLDAGVVGNRPILRPRQPGDTFFPLGLGGHSKKVNEFMINEKIPARWRDHIPLLTAENQILWVCGYRPDDRARVRPNTRQIVHLKFERL